METVKIILFILIFTVIILVHEGGHCLIGKKCGIGVKEFAIGLGPTIIGFTRGGTKYSIKALPFGGVCIFEGDDGENDSPNSFRNAPVWARIATVAAGPIMNFVLAFVLSLFIVGSIGYDAPVIYSTMDGYPAAEAGLVSGDRIVAISGKKIDVYRDITLWTMFNTGKTAEITYERDGKKYKTEITPEYNKEEGRYLFGFTGPEGYVKGNPLQVIKYSCVEVRYWIEVTVKSLIMLARGQFTVNDLSGPVGIAQTVGQVYDESKSSGVYYIWLNMMSLCTLISANLGVMNLLPFPALDGGRLVFLIFEAVTKKKADEKVEGVVNFIGMALLMLLMFFVMFNDISTLIKH